MIPCTKFDPKVPTRSPIDVLQLATLRNPEHDKSWYFSSPSV